MTGTALATRNQIALIERGNLGRTRLEGQYFLLGQSLGFADQVSRYSEGDMDELFSAEQRARLEAGETIDIRGLRWTDMVAAARAAARN